MQFWNVLRAAQWKCRTQKIAKKSPSGHHRTTLSGYIFATKARIDNRKKNLFSSISPTCPHNMVNFVPLVAEICWRVWGTPANFNAFHVLATLLHGILVVGVSQTLRHWTESATYNRQGCHHVGHWPTFLVNAVTFLLARLQTWRVIIFSQVCLSNGCLTVCLCVSDRHFYPSTLTDFDEKLGHKDPTLT